MVFESKGSKKAREYEKGEGYEKYEKKRLVKKITMEGSTIEYLYEEDGKIKRGFVVHGTKGKGGNVSVAGFGGGANYSETTLHNFTEDDVKQKIAWELGCNIDSLPSIEEIKNPSFISFLYERADKIVDELLSEFSGQDTIPANRFREAYAEIESLLELSTEVKNSLRLIQSFRELHDGLNVDNEAGLSYQELEKARNTKERFFRNLEAFEDVMGGRE